MKMLNRLPHFSLLFVYYPRPLVDYGLYDNKDDTLYCHHKQFDKTKPSITLINLNQKPSTLRCPSRNMMHWPVRRSQTRPKLSRPPLTHREPS